MQRKYIIVAAVMIAAVLAGAYLWTDLGIKGNRVGASQTSSETPVAATVNVDEQDIVKEIHLMSNSLIQAGDKQIWGQKDVNKTSIEKVIKMLDQATESARTEQLREIVVRWKQGDFSQIVDDHNYVWDLLGGTVGLASSSNDEAVAEAIANLKDSGQ
ncbi:MAG TPA: DUF6241 domain-containing protein [Clostridiaceae bacterium]